MKLALSLLGSSSSQTGANTMNKRREAKPRKPLIDLIGLTGTEVANHRAWCKTKAGKAWLAKIKLEAKEKAEREIQRYQWHCPGCCQCRGTP